MTSCSVYTLGEVAGGQQLLLGDGLDIVHWVVSNCIVHHLFCVDITIAAVVIIIVIISSFAFLLNCLRLNSQVFTFSHSLPHPTVGG